MRRARSLVIGLASLAWLMPLVAGCSSSPTPDASAGSDLAGQLAQAQAAGADESQLEVLRGSDVTFADYEGAMNRALDCMEQSGVTVQRNGTARHGGVLLVDYLTSMPDADAARQASLQQAQDACYRRYAQFVDLYWQAMSPDAVAWSQRRATALLEPLRQCLDGYGVDYPSDETFDPLVNRALALIQQDESKDCLTQIGFSTWDG